MSSSTTVNPSQKMTSMCHSFLNKISQATKGQKIDEELEARFKNISKIDYDNVVKKLISLGFTRHPVAISLNVILKDNYRIPITGEQNVYNYCNTERMTDTIFNNAEKKNRIDMIDFEKEQEFPFRFTLSVEQRVSEAEKESIRHNYSSSEKLFRYIRRVSFTHENYPYLVIDLSTIKQSPKFSTSFRSSGIFTSNILDTYEIEIEFKQEHDAYYRGTEAFKRELKLTDATIKKQATTQFQKYVKYVLGGIQQSNYPLSIKNQNAVKKDYGKILDETSTTLSPAFIGPSSKTLQIDNIVPVKTGNTMKIPNIRIPGAFCVTEKADGERHLMVVNETGKIYLLTSNMNVKFTGAKCDPKVCRNTIIDGELILHNKKREFINTFAAFDLYYLNGEDVRSLKFMPIPKVLEKYISKTEQDIYRDEQESDKDDDVQNKRKQKREMDEKWQDKYRLTMLNEIMNAIRLQLSATLAPGEMIFKTKDFYPLAQNAVLTKEDEILAAYNIFTASKVVLDMEYPYETDGLIFTHTSFGVGGDGIGEAGPLRKITWDYSMKWKPAKLNTNDFLVVTEKDETKGGKDKITNKFQDGTNMLNSMQTLEYKHLQLFCGSRSQNEVFEHPCEDIYNGILPKREDQQQKQQQPTRRNVYQATPFVPVNPYDANAAYTMILLNKDGLMITEEGQPFESDTIVEFRYDTKHHRWIALRVRYDKTAEYKAGKPQFGNSFETANSNWTSIHFPITQHMISTGKREDGSEILETEYNPDAYYRNNADAQTQTRGLRDFHNKYVKQWLIKSVCRPGNTLIDLACGKAGDLQKWIHAKLSFVYGIDYSQDNLTNLLNGACTRYLNTYKQYRNMPASLFVQGDSGKNILSGAAMFNERGKQINEVVFGERRTGKDAAMSLGKGVMRQASKGKDGFNVSSCQFAMHYMFATPSTFYNFVENIAECTKNNGYYIATCYDGASIFELLKGKTKDSIVKENKLVWEIVRKYNGERTIFPDNETSLGMEISVYQESINAWISEYLVNFEFFNKTMNEYGMYLLTDAELNEINFPLKKSTGLFSDLYSQMLLTPNAERMYGTAANMKDYEKKISFLNRYFIYRSRNSVKRDFSNITSAKLSKFGKSEAEAAAVAAVTTAEPKEPIGEAAAEHKMMDDAKDLENCEYDSRLHRVLAKITKERNKKSSEIQNILDLIEKSGDEPADKPSVRRMQNIDQQLMKYKKPKDPNEGKEFICKQMIEFIKNKLIKSTKKKVMTRDTRIIDIGGGNGNLLHCFSEKFGIPKKNLVNIENGSFEYDYTHQKTVTYKTLKPSDGDDIMNISGEVFKNADYILCMVVLHHMTDENIDNTVKFIRKHIKRGGYVFIKEHDADTKDVRCLINWEHHLYRLMEHTDGDMPVNEIQKYVDDVYIGNYKKEVYFDRLFQGQDFKLVATLDHVMGGPLKSGADKWERNPTQLFWKVYQYAE